MTQKALPLHRAPPEYTVDVQRGIRADELVQLLERLPGRARLRSLQGVGRDKPGKLRFDRGD